MSKSTWNKIIWTDEVVDFIKANYTSMDNKAIADFLELKLQTLRDKCYELGLKRMELEYWTDEQINFLKDNYEQCGDKELAELFNKNFSKQKGWTLKHIEKKRKYLNLKRTEQQLKDIKQKAIDQGMYIGGVRKTWRKRGVFPNGTIRYWKPNYDTNRRYPVIKINGKYIHWSVYTWEKNFGPIPNGMNVVFKNNNPNTDPENLELVSKSELSRRNTQKGSKGLSDGFIAGMLTYNRPELRSEIKKQKDLIDLQRTKILLQRVIKAKTQKANAI